MICNNVGLAAKKPHSKQIIIINVSSKYNGRQELV
jgi:hypothetical protein